MEDLYSAQLGIPDVEDCSTDFIPHDVTKNKREVFVPVLKTMTKYLFDRYRLPMYTYINQLLRKGLLSSIVQEKVCNRIFNRQSCWFPNVTFWQVDRENCLADVSVTLKLETEHGQTEWNGFLTFWLCFTEDFNCSIEGLSAEVERDDYLKMDACLVPICSNKHMDILSELIWEKYIPSALVDSTQRRAENLAAAMGLRISFHDVYNHNNTIDSIVFFDEGDLQVGEDRIVRNRYGQVTTVKDKEFKIVHIPANTIVINTNKIRQDYSSYNIFHECIHYELHYMFFRLQQMASNDPRIVEVEKKVIEEDKEYKDPIYFMEKQANRGAYGLLLPITETSRVIAEEKSRINDYAHDGELYESIGMSVSDHYHLPHFRVRPRMIQLGHYQAKGTLNYINGIKIPPFAFDADSLQDEALTLVIDRAVLYRLCNNEPLLQRVIESEEYVYADGHVVKNDPKYVERGVNSNRLTDWANAHADKCCLRFVRKYVQVSVGRYVYGRMYLDTDYIERTNVFLKDLMAKEAVDEIDAQDVYVKRLPRDFKKLIDTLRKPEKISEAKLAEIMNMDDRTLSRWLENPTRYRNEDFLMMICLSLKLPDWLSNVVFRRAGLQLDEDEKRNKVFLRILRTQTCEGIEEANKTLSRYQCQPLALG